MSLSEIFICGNLNTNAPQKNIPTEVPNKIKIAHLTFEKHSDATETETVFQSIIYVQREIY